MSTEKLQELLGQIQDLEELDTLLRSRRALRDVYSFLGDAWMLTHNRTFHLYMVHIAQAGSVLNQDLAQWMSKVNREHFEQDVIAQDSRQDKEG
jgi:hypothetical protein